MSAAIEGFLLSFGLILAIGAQNAFVLRQGLKREYVLMVTTICAVADALLIGAGVMGLGSLIREAPGLIQIVTIGGAIFLFVYGLLALRRALSPSALQAAADRGLSYRAAILTVLAFTFLNPHVYLDTVVMLGGLSARYDLASRFAFWGGGALASAVFFYSLGFGARWLSPIFARPSAWRVFDVIVGLIMWGIAASLLATLA